MKGEGMNRRNLLKTALSVPVAGMLSACKGDTSSGRASKGILKVILNGPFGVVLDSKNKYQITAYVPSDPLHEHELFFRGPGEPAGREAKSGKSPSYYYKLPSKGLDIGEGRPQIDQGFYDFNFPHIGDWKLPSDPFVVIDLPRPDYITFTPPAQPFLFGGNPTLQPLDHIFEYRMTDPDDVHMTGNDGKEYPPLPCSKLLTQYEDYWKKYPPANPRTSQKKNMEEMLRSCSSSDLCILFGVGFDPDQYQYGKNLQEHGIRFFNQVLLPSLAPAVQERLQEENCQPATKSMASSSELMPAVLTYPQSRPRLFQVSAVLDCTAGGAMGTRP
jgi:hypothetical protein